MKIKLISLVAVGLIAGLIVIKPVYAEQISGSCTQGENEVFFSSIDPPIFGMIAELFINDTYVYAQKTISVHRQEIVEDVAIFLQGQQGQAYAVIPLELFNNGVPLKIGVQESGKDGIACTLVRTRGKE